MRVKGLNGFGYASWSTYSSGTRPRLPSIAVAGLVVTLNPVGKVAVPPPGDGFVTLTARLPVEAVGEIEMLTSISVVLLTFVLVTVMSGPKLTVVTPEMNCVPVTVTLTRLPLPADVGARVLRVGSGFLTVNAPERLAEPPPGAAFVTATSLVPAAASAATVTVASSSVRLLITRLDTLTPLPKLTEVTPLMNCVPVTTTVADPPLKRLVGATDARVGAGFVTLNPFVSVAVPPPGAAFVT
jgi:hypothetical protein